MSVPKAAVNEDNQFVSFQDKIWLPQQVLHMKSEPVSQPVDYPPDQYFGNRSFGSYPTHDLTSFLFTGYIGHFGYEIVKWLYRII